MNLKRVYNILAILRIVSLLENPITNNVFVSEGLRGYDGVL